MLQVPLNLLKSRGTFRKNRTRIDRLGGLDFREWTRLMHETPNKRLHYLNSVWPWDIGNVSKKVSPMLEISKSHEVAIPDDVKAILRRQKYHIVGQHSAIKKCRWLHNSLVKGEYCYKHKFYGIESHRCVQCTPSVIWCTNQCIYCWRIMPGDYKLNWNQMALMHGKADDPETIIDGCIREQRKILTGYKPLSHRQVSWEKWNEAMEPRHFAISLSGEPLLYSRLSEMVEIIRKRGFTAFVVTNGILPNRLKDLSEPTQLYVSVSAPNRETHKRVCRPLLRDGWERLIETIELLPTFSCPIVLRLTMVEGYNMHDPEGYGKLIDMSNCTYVEVKAAMFVGGAQLRMVSDNMPRHDTVKKFAEKICEESGYRIINESIASRVVLLSRLKESMKVA